MARRYGGWLLLLAGCLAAAGPAQAQPAPTATGGVPIVEAGLRAHAFLDRMVRVTGRAATGKTGVSGYGFVVGEHATAQGQPGYLVVTPDHLIHDPANPTLRFEPPRVSFYTDRDRNVAADVLDVRLPPQQGDLDVLVVPKLTTRPMPDVVMADTQALLPGMATWQLGLPDTWVLGSASARFALREPAGWLNFEGLDGSPGAVGGAVVTELGLTGMVVGFGPGLGTPARVLPVDLMATKFREWGLAWGIPKAGEAVPAAPNAGNVAANAAPVAPAAPPKLAPPKNDFGALTVMMLLPSELATRGNWVPPDARVSPWARSGAALLAAPRMGANRIGELPAGYLLPQELWARGAYEIQARLDNGAWFLLGSPGQPMGYVAGTDVVEVWPPEKPGTAPQGKVVREFPLKAGKAVLRDAGTHYDLTAPLLCDLAVCDTILIYTPIPPTPGGIVPTFQVPRIAGSWQQNDIFEIHVPLPRALVETKGAVLMTCVGLESSCRQERLPVGG